MTALFAGPPGNRIFAVPPGRDFSTALVAGLIERYRGRPPEHLARLTVFTNTRRAARRLETVFGETGAYLLPRIRVASDIGQDPILAGPRTEPAIALHLRLAQLVRRLLETEPGLAPPVAAFDLAQGLAALMDEMAGAGIDPAGLESLPDALASRHWQTALRFLRLIVEHWPVAGSGPEARQSAAVAALSRHWLAHPPTEPVIVAGSTGSRAPMAALMNAVLDLPQGALVLPGVDTALDAAAWDALAVREAADHPQHRFALLAGRVGISPTEFRPWHDPSPPTPRARLISLGLRPAPVTHDWRRLGPALAPEVPEALAGIDLLSAPHERAEAAAIAVALRSGIDTGATAALITPDGTLARRVTAALARWGILPDESAGQPLDLTPEGVFLGLLLDWAANPGTVIFTALVKHPLAASTTRGAHLDLVRLLDATVLRDHGPVVDWSALRRWADARGEEAATWIAGLQAALDSPAPGLASLADHIAHHRRLAEALSGDRDFWASGPGEAIDAILSELTEVTEAAGPLTHRDYRALFTARVTSEKRRAQGYAPDQRVLIWGQLEARVQSADLIVLGGLNEGTWPAQPPADPWLNRDMRKALGLSLPERLIGLAAHDFQQAACAPRVILSRSARIDNTPAVPSRWLVRLENLVAGMGAPALDQWDAARARGDAWLARAEALEAPAARVDPAPRPAPVPPLAARPTRLYVTHAETLVRDPYAYYARQILGLRPLPPMGRLPDMRDRGNALHAAIEAFIAETMDSLPPDAEAVFRRVLDRVMETGVPWPAERRLWHARLLRVAADFVANERERRAIATPARLEVKGAVPIPGFARPLELAAKADRIDKAPDGGLAIYDYKASVPTDAQAKIFDKQLPLEAKMASMGGFLDGTPRQTKRLELIGLSKPGDTRDFPLTAEEIDKIWAEFLRLVAHYEDPAKPYASRLRVHKARDAGDYDQLARRGEWDDGADFTPEAVP